MFLDELINTSSNLGFKQGHAVNKIQTEGINVIT